MFKISFGNQDNDFRNLKDDELIKKTQQGQTIAFEILYDRYKDKIYSYIRNILNYNEQESTIVLSDVFIKLFEYISKNEIKSFKTFLYKVAHNTCIDFIRSNKSEYRIDENTYVVEDSQDSIQKDNFNTEFKQKIMMDYLGQLDEKHRDVLYLYYQEEKSYDEIAEIIGSNKNSVGTLIFNAKKELKEKIKDEKLLEEITI
ncbi:RNA polymerase sigma factor [Candidatus Gracilibacteria bacterium]|nr:RNA polymerase sigma factor [Candidatus Gracilibacteria bacterium]